MDNPLGITLISAFFYLNGIFAFLPLASIAYISILNFPSIPYLGFALYIVLGVVLFFVGYMISKLKKIGLYLGIAISAIIIVASLISFSSSSLISIVLMFIVIIYLMMKRNLFV